VLKKCAIFIAKLAPKNCLATPFKTRAAKNRQVDEQQRADLQKRVETESPDRFIPLIQLSLFQELLPKTTTDDGVWKLPDGDGVFMHTRFAPTPPQHATNECMSSVCAK